MKTKPIAIFYHVYMSGGQIPCCVDNVTRIVTDQLASLNASHLVQSSEHFEIGVNGTELEWFIVKSMAGTQNTHRNTSGVGELPTMRRMQLFCKSHPGWAVCYFHTKGAIHNGNPIYESWRKCMESVVIWGWQKCVNDINRGYDTVGAHWLTPARFSFIGPVPYWGGNFFWASSDYLNTLPEIDINADRYQAEVWIGKFKRKPNVLDYKRHFPMTGCST